MRDASTIIPIQTVILCIVGVLIVVGLAAMVWNDPEDHP